MAEINRRERKKIFSQKAIVESAVKLFTQKGYQETTVADIMSEADLGIGTFYNYFQSKEDILKHLLFVLWLFIIGIIIIFLSSQYSLLSSYYITLHIQHVI